MIKKVGSIILAAGKSQRMGKNKIFMSFRNRPMIAGILSNIACCDIVGTIIVIGYEFQNALACLAAIPEAETAAIFINQEYEKGMGTSLAIGAQGIPNDWDAVLIMLGDMPLISSEIITKILESYEEISANQTIIVPTYQKRRGHPVLFAKQHFEELAQLNGDIGARSVLQKNSSQIQFIEIDSPYILTDIDTKEEFQQWNL